MKLLLSVLFLSLSLVTKSQDREDGRTVTIPFRVAKNIQQELLSKDSCTDMLNVANEEIYLLGRSVEFKNKMIDTLTYDIWVLQKSLENEKNLKITYKGLAEDCKTEYDALKMKSTTYKKFTKVVGFLGTAVIAGLTAVILFVK